MCTKCHEEIRAEFLLPEPSSVIRKKKVFALTGHDSYGTPNEKSLRKNTVKETCTQCHAEKEGPFVFEHADNSEECSSCHSSHGSINNYLLNVRVPFLCLQCHEGHRTELHLPSSQKGHLYELHRLSFEHSRHRYSLCNKSREVYTMKKILILLFFSPGYFKQFGFCRRD